MTAETNTRRDFLVAGAALAAATRAEDGGAGRAAATANP